MSAIFHNKYLEFFGFHTENNSAIEKNGTTTRSEMIKFQNIRTIISWIPIIGAILGGLSIYAVYDNSKGFREDLGPRGKGALTRCIVEVGTLGCAGPLLAVVDLVVTLGRSCFPLPQEHYSI